MNEEHGEGKDDLSPLVLACFDLFCLFLGFVSLQDLGKPKGQKHVSACQINLSLFTLMYVPDQSEQIEKNEHDTVCSTIFFCGGGGGVL